MTVGKFAPMASPVPRWQRFISCHNRKGETHNYPPKKPTWNLKMISSSRGSFSGSMLVFRGVLQGQEADKIHLDNRLQ